MVSPDERRAISNIMTAAATEALRELKAPGMGIVTR
jgi:hypothetical protein